MWVHVVLCAMRELVRWFEIPPLGYTKSGVSLVLSDCWKQALHLRQALFHIINYVSIDVWAPTLLIFTGAMGRYQVMPKVWVPFQQCCTRGKLLRMISTVAMISKSKTWMNRMNMVRFECEGNQLPDAMCRRLPFSTYLASSMEKSKHEEFIVDRFVETLGASRIVRWSAISGVSLHWQEFQLMSTTLGSAGSVRTAGSARSSLQPSG